MKTSDLGVVFDDTVSPKAWASIDSFKDQVEALWFGTIQTPLGEMTLIGAEDKLCYLGFEENRSIEKCSHFFKSAEFIRNDRQAEQMGKKVLDIWNGRSKESLKIITNGTEFQENVWKSLLRIPLGHVVSYGIIAQFIENPKAVRAVGTAVGANPISLIIPCHRVVQQSGQIENYGWGDAMKQKILKIECGFIKERAKVA